MIFENKTILVTGGTGSLGKVLVRRILSGEQGTPKKLIVFSRDEGKQHAMRQSYLNKAITTDEVIYNNFSQKLEFRIGDVTRYSDICRAIKDCDIVVNAAALKQVPTCEYFPEQALYTNCMGAVNITRAIHEFNHAVGTVVGVSTDKACKPVNVMGMSKALQERVFTSANILSPKTRFICVRYGNVLASRGSVIPLFHEQIRHGGPITITDPDMTRFLLSIDEAVDTIFAAITHGKAGETFIPNVPSATVISVAKALIGDKPIKTEIIGVRPGEKAHEILVSEEECHHTSERKGYYVIHAMLPELQKEKIKPALTDEFSSKNNVLDEQGTIALLKKHRLLNADDLKYAEGNELLV